MRFAHLLEIIYARPWSITPAGWEAVHRIVQSKLDGQIMEPVTRDDEDDDLDIFGEPLPKSMLSDGGTLSIPIQGVIGRKIGMIGKACGGCDIQDVEFDIAKALGDSRVSRILLDIDSPGGSVTGVPELAQQIRDARVTKPVYAFTDGMMCSAAYWLASQADGIYATKSTDIGSIGVYMALLDESRSFEMEGLKTELIKAGRLKGIGVRGTALTDEAREYLQGQVDDIYEWFTTDVRAGRQNQVTDDTMQGQSFMADEAARRKLIDVVVPNLQAALVEMTERDQRQTKWKGKV